MRYNLSILLLIIFIFHVGANRLSENKEILINLGNKELLSLGQCDTLINYADYKIRLIKNIEGIEHLGLNLFKDNIKETIDEEMLNFVETALLAKILEVEIEGNTEFLFFGGNISDLRYVSPEIPCKISNLNSRFLSFEWDIMPDYILRIDVPIGYSNAKGGQRGEIEDDFINKIKTSNLKRTSNFSIQINSLKPYKGVYIFYGQHYLKDEINRNMYFTGDSNPKPLMSLSYPLESISNLFISPISDERLINVEVTVLKHEYGKKESFITPLENLLAVCEADGCLPYWGVEEFNDGHLTGSLFLYNWKQGYDHVFKIECVPEEILNGKGKIKARASLFIPTNNIQTLFENI